ncbi:MAG: hypothetical protein RIT27_1291 [Pseudomonadota bacterium]|jgi:hypothetical protein
MDSIVPHKMLVTSEMMRNGVKPLLFTGGACNIQTEKGTERNRGRDELAKWLNEKEWSYFDPQIHQLTHGREYIWDIDGLQEKRAREIAKLRIYEITPTTIASMTMLEIMDDARLHRMSIVWFNDGGESFSPIGLGNKDELLENIALKEKVGNLVFSHLLAYVNAGRQTRTELQLMLADCQSVVFVNSFDELKLAITHLIAVVMRNSSLHL